MLSNEEQAALDREHGITPSSVKIRCRRCAAFWGRYVWTVGTLNDARVEALDAPGVHRTPAAWSSKLEKIVGGMRSGFSATEQGYEWTPDCGHSTRISREGLGSLIAKLAPGEDLAL